MHSNNIMTDQAERNIGGKVDLFAKTAAVALSILYICGFFVVSLYLAGFGIHSVALLRVQYLAAGFFSLGPLCLTYFVASLLHLGFEKLFVGESRLGSVPASVWPRIRWASLALLRIVWEFLQVFIGAGLVIDGVVSIFVPGVQDLLWHHKWVFVRMMRDLALGILFMLRAISVVSKQERELNFKTAFQVGLPATFSVFFFLAYMSQFSLDVYPNIPFAVGGGKPESVVFLLKHDAVSPPPVVRDKTSDRSIPYSLILETDNAYAVVSQDSNERTIQFNREAVEGYIVLGQK
jgi:hypothetical protein